MEVIQRVALQKAVDELQRKGICRIPKRARCFSIRKASGWISKERRNSLASRFGEGIDDQEEREAILDAWHRLGRGAGTTENAVSVLMQYARSRTARITGTRMSGSAR